MQSAAGSHTSHSWRRLDRYSSWKQGLWLLLCDIWLLIGFIFVLSVRHRMSAIMLWFFFIPFVLCAAYVSPPLKMTLSLQPSVWPTAPPHPTWPFSFLGVLCQVNGDTYTHACLCTRALCPGHVSGVLNLTGWWTHLIWTRANRYCKLSDLNWDERF